jgi:multidrug efflux pump subunit AcrA (membrane-fusion protein)
MRNIIVFILALLLIIGAIYLGDTIANSKNKTRAIPEKVIKTVFVDTVQNGTVQIVIPANGSLMSKHRVELYSEVQGVFKSSGKLFKPGQEYRKGETLIRIDASEYYASVQSSKSNLYNSIAAIMPDLRLDFPEVFPKWQIYLKYFYL